jgi:predicted nucleic acid-binding protein
LNYLDTSALIKRFVSEQGSRMVQTLVTREGPIATAKIAYAEVYAGLARKRREGHLAPSQYARVTSQFERDWLAYVRIDLHDEVLRIARDLVQRHPLKGFDAIHLASALSLGRGLEEEVSFVAADERLLRAAEAEGLRPFDVARPPAS